MVRRAFLNNMHPERPVVLTFYPRLGSPGRPPHSERTPRTTGRCIKAAWQLLKVLA
jgi:hypothetical protein